MLFLEFNTVCNDYKDIFNFLCDKGVLRREFNCVTCGELMIKTVDWRYQYCRRVQHYTDSHKKKQTRRCNSKINALHGSIFEGSRLGVQKVCSLISLYLILNPPHYEIMMVELRCSPNSLIGWTRWIREICTEWLEQNSSMLGGPGVVIEIDESHVGRCEKGVWGVDKGKWVFGAFERGSKKLFIVSIPDRKSITLIEIIKRWILPGSIIISDSWPSYHSLNKIGYEHLKINHRVEYVDYKDPRFLVHTQHIERSWQEMKRRTTSSCLRGRDCDGHLIMFLFKRAIKHSKRLDTFFQFIGELGM